jgi:hypothetical protein
MIAPPVIGFHSTCLSSQYAVGINPRATRYWMVERSESRTLKLEAKPAFGDQTLCPPHFVARLSKVDLFTY